MSDNKNINSDENKRTLTVLVVPPLQTPFIKEIDAGLESLQKEVDGDIEAVYPFDDKVAVICNDEGKLNGMAYNRALYDSDGQVYDVIAGTFLVAGLGEEDFTSLTNEQIEKFSELFKQPEMFIRRLGELVVVPIKPSIRESLKQPAAKGQEPTKSKRKPPDMNLE